MPIARVSFFVSGDARPQPRIRARVVGTRSKRPYAQLYTPQTIREWKNAVIAEARRHAPPIPWDAPVRVSEFFFLERPASHWRGNRIGGTLKPNAPFYCTGLRQGDRDNLDKAILDALTNSRMFVDDSRACSGMIEKLWAGPHTRETPGVFIVIERISDVPFADTLYYAYYRGDST